MLNNLNDLSILTFVCVNRILGSVAWRLSFRLNAVTSWNHGEVDHCKLKSDPSWWLRVPSTKQDMMLNMNEVPEVFGSSVDISGHSIFAFTVAV